MSVSADRIPLPRGEIYNRFRLLPCGITRNRLGNADESKNDRIPATVLGIKKLQELNR